jgi:hypothetical protein
MKRIFNLLLTNLVMGKRRDAVHLNKLVKTKKNFNIFKYLALFLVLVLVVVIMGVIFLVNENNYVNAEFDAFKIRTNGEILNLQNNILVLNSENNSLSSNLDNLGDDFDKLQTSTRDLNLNYSVLKDEAENTIEKITNYEKELQDSMQWFGTNAILSSKQNRLLTILKANCKKRLNDTCKINLGCVFLINSEFENFKYINDEITSNEIDKLQSIEEFISNKGGDCEDYSLLFKAEFNSLIKSCEKDNLKINLVAWEEFDSSKRLWLNNSQTWYFENARAVNIENNFPNIVCGNMFDLQSKKINGHCVIAFTKNKIESISDLNLLSNAPLVEPQSGKYMGKINSTSNIFLINDNYSNIDSYINTVITDDDFFLFSRIENSWQNYGKFATELLEKQESLENLIKDAN